MGLHTKRCQSVLILLLLFVSLNGIFGQACNSSCQLPSCSCSRFTYPMETHTIPQMVFFAYDDAVTAQVARFYEQLFSENRTNPNGCRMKMSLFISDAYTDYTEVKKLYDQGHEIAVHSVTHMDINTDSLLRGEARDQRRNLSNAGIPIHEIVGWRSPNLKTAGQNQPTILKEENYTYDISLTYTISALSSNKPWPFTMTDGWPYSCSIPPCPENTTIEDFWHVPAIALMDKNNQYPCAYVDGCHSPPTNEEESFNFLWNNFMSYYNSTRTPFGFNMHAAWYVNREFNLIATKRFLDKLIDEFDDVYVVTVKQVLDWMRNPTAIADLGSLQSWQCDGTENESTSSSSTSSTSSGATTTTTTTAAATTPTTTAANTATASSTTGSSTSSSTTSTSSTTSSTSSQSTTACRAIGAQTGNPAMDTWCTNNCLNHNPFCPSNMCTCDGQTSAATTASTSATSSTSSSPTASLSSTSTTSSASMTSPTSTTSYTLTTPSTSTTSSTSTTDSTTGSTSSSCRAAGVHVNTEGMDQWCVMNCPSNCPPTHCTCD